ncbi:MAG: DUF2892 domain-containing protein [Bacteroidota bacterium]|nr:DUF2892 domain-containing protein [Bacteroidota bacterium]MDP4206299.1 DUF2892 domain-containing protein [Bacteroidota bacterium]
MKCNVGKSDKVVRIALGIHFLIVGIYYGSWFGLIGLIPLITGIFSFCPFYTLFNITTDSNPKMIQE